MTISFFVDERYDKGFQVSVSIDGITADRKLVSVLPPEAGHNRYECSCVTLQSNKLR